MSADRRADPPANQPSSSLNMFGAEELPDEAPRRIYSANPKSKYKYRPGEQEEEVLAPARRTVGAFNTSRAPDYEESNVEETFEPPPYFHSSNNDIEATRRSGAARTATTAAAPGAVRVSQRTTSPYVPDHDAARATGRYAETTPPPGADSGVAPPYPNEIPHQPEGPYAAGAPVSAVVINSIGEDNMDASCGVHTGGESTALSTEEAENRKDRKIVVLVVILVFVLLLAIIVGVVVGIVSSRGGDDPTPAPTPFPTFSPRPLPTEPGDTTPAPTSNNETPPPTPAPTTTPPPAGSDITELVLGVIPSLDITPYGDPDTPQGQAVTWIEGDTFSDDDDRRLQRFALATLYYAMGGEVWNEATNWLSSLDECGVWNNLVCSLSMEVLEVRLYDDGLVGTIPPEIALLSSLTFLDLTHSEAGGRLGGPIPTELGLMTTLKEIYLAFMSFTGTIPTEIGLLTDLDTFWGFQNRFSSASIPTEIGAATSLTDIRLFRNNLISSVPAEIVNLSNLEALIISTNFITGTLPAGMSQMTKLTNINVWGNRIEGPMPDLAGLTSLTSLLTWDTSLVGVVPSSLCPTLDDVRVECDRFLCTCCLDEDENECPPDELLTAIGDRGISTDPLLDPTSPQGKAVYWLLNDTYSSDLSLDRRIQRYALAAIFYATGGETEWSSSPREDFLLPSDECQWTEEVTCSSGNVIDRIYLFLNSMAGTFPDDVGLLTALTELDWHWNDVAGTIPTTIGLLTELSILRFDQNVMTGPIPTELGLCTKLSHLNADENRLGPSIPTELGLLVQMNYLSLEENNITSSIPSELALMTNLSLLELSETELTGKFPLELEGLTALSYIDLFSNFMTGPLPDIASWPNMESLSLEGAGSFTGTIPTTISQLVKLTFLTLGKLDLGGTIPTELGVLTNLEALSLTGNSFSQPTIPTQLGNLLALKALWINEASLVGSLPSEIGRLTALTTLHFSDLPNRLVGSLPTEFSALTNLRFFGVRNNRLTGSIPSSLGLWSNLEFFYMPGNLLTGGIPTEIGFMTKLTTVILASNPNLGGPIPTEIGGLGLLGDFRVHDGGHTGQVPTGISELTLLTLLSLSPNNIGGPLPDLSKLTNLESLFLFDSELTGTVSSDICPGLEVAQIDCGELVCGCCQSSVGTPCL